MLLFAVDMKIFRIIKTPMDSSLLQKDLKRSPVTGAP